MPPFNTCARARASVLCVWPQNLLSMFNVKAPAFGLVSLSARQISLSSPSPPSRLVSHVSQLVSI